MDSLIGKTVAKASQDSLKTNLILEFTDGTTLKVEIGKTYANYDYWSTIEYEIKD